MSACFRRRRSRCTKRQPSWTAPQCRSWMNTKCTDFTWVASEGNDVSPRFTAVEGHGQSLNTTHRAQARWLPLAFLCLPLAKLFGSHRCKCHFLHEWRRDVSRCLLVVETQHAQKKQNQEEHQPNKTPKLPNKTTKPKHKKTRERTCATSAHMTSSPVQKVDPNDAALSGLLFTPFLRVATQSAPDLCAAWTMYGTFMLLRV